jgi:hypothetical protein
MACLREKLLRELVAEAVKAHRIIHKIMANRDADIAEAAVTTDATERESRVEDVKAVKTATRDAERAWLRYAEAWKRLVANLRPDDNAVLDDLRAFLTEQRIRELKYTSVGDSSTTDPEEPEEE